MRVLIPGPLRPYTQRAWVDASGSSLADVLADLDRQFPGIRFRMVNEQERLRPHVRIFVRGEPVFDLGLSLAPNDDVLIVQALSGG